MRNMQGGVGGKGGPMTFGRSKAKLLDGGHVKTNFNDVAGCEEAFTTTSVGHDDSTVRTIL